MKQKILLLIFMLFILFTGGTLILREHSFGPSVPEVVETTRFLMGTSWKVKVSLDSGPEKEIVLKAMDGVFRELARIEDLMSEWQPDTPVSRINQGAGGQAVEVPEELLQIIERGIEYGRLSKGAFDITWRGMGSLWSLGDDFSVPDEQEVRAAVKRVGYSRISIEGNKVLLPDPGMAIGLGGIAKGYAIDRAGLKLRQAGIQNFMVDGGGDILVSGHIGDRSWRLGIRDPRGGPDDLIKKLSVQDGAVVTSGDYERFRLVNGRRYHHIIDPRTGWPAEGCRSVTVFSPGAERADVLATAVFVLGPDEGLELVEALEDSEALVVDSSGEIMMTSGFGKLISD